MKEKLIRVGEYVLFIIFLILIPFMKSIYTIILFIPTLILILYITKRVNIKHFSILIFLLAAFIRIISITYLKVANADDFKVMSDAASNLISGNTRFLNTFYFKTFSYQLGHVFYQALLLKVINNITFLKVVNSVVGGLIVMFIYLISKTIYNERIGQISSLIYLFYLYPVYLCSILTNQHLPILIVLVTIYLLLTKKIDYKLMIIIGVLLGISNILRAESIIIIISIIIYMILTTNKYIKNVVVLLLSYFLLSISVNTISTIALGTPLKNNAPLWKFYCGLSYDNNGIYNEQDQKDFFNSSNKNKLLIERIRKENIKLPVLFLKKEVILWTQTNYDLRISNSINNIILLFNQGVLNTIIILFVISLYPCKRIDNKKLLIEIIIFMYYLIYMFIEISPRYAYILHVLIILIIGDSIKRLENICKARLK